MQTHSLHSANGRVTLLAISLVLMSVAIGLGYVAVLTQSSAAITGVTVREILPMGGLSILVGLCALSTLRAAWSGVSDD